MAKILIVGCGAIGSKLATEISANGHKVTGLKRTPPTISDGWNYFLADISNASDLVGLPTDFDQIFFIVSTGQRGPENYRKIYQTGLTNLCNHFANNPIPPHWIFVSSSSVYGQSQGEWVDENSVVEPVSPSSKSIRTAEQQLLRSCPDSVIVRFTGIYGAGRNRLIKMAKTSPAIQNHPPYYTNRIHEQDCIGVLKFLLNQRLSGKHLESYYLATDDHPVPQWEVISWLTQQMGVPAPTIKTVDNQIAMNKRCSNKKLKALGYHFKYPSYRDGYKEMLN